MLIDEFNQVVQFVGVTPETHDFYVAYFRTPISDRDFLSRASSMIENFSGVWYRSMGSSIYFAVESTAVVPDDFADSLIRIQILESGE